ncbi:MAG: CotH kinase family protein [Prevotella sp.]|nr:CotH kinase family protein [Prevotella sp.]
MIQKTTLMGLMVTLLCALAPLQSYAEKNWIDVTEEYLVNPNFDGNTNVGWTYSSNAGSQAVRCEAMEFWNGTWDLYQIISILPAGQYRFSVQSYYRCQDNDPGYQNYLNNSEDITGMMYAGDAEQPIVSIYSFSFDNNVPDGCWGYWNYDTWEQIYFPNTMESGTEAFNRGAYWNHMEFEHDGGELQLGLRNQGWIQGNWCLFDNFRLEYYGEVVLCTGLSIEPTKKEIIVGETFTPTVSFSPSNVTYKKLTWSSSDESVATVDENGAITGISKGYAQIYARTTDSSNITISMSVNVTSNDATSESLVINEIMASNIDEFVSPAFNFDGWVELYNPTDKAAQLDRIYMSDDPSDLKKWYTPADMGTIPAHGYYVVWFDSNDIRRQNAQFKLDVDGGTLYISNAQGKVIAQQDYPASLQRVSYARTTDGGSVWGLTERPTPGASNAKSTFAELQLAAPVVDQPSQLFTGQVTLNVEIPAGCVLRYTTDGTLPSRTNGMSSSSGLFVINQTSMYRFRLFAMGYLASPVTTRSFIYRDRDYMLPVVSVVSDPDFLYDDSIGVYVRGTNGRPGNGQSSPCNWNMNWERPVNFSYIDANGEMVLNQDVNFEMCGGWSRAWEPHSFKLKGSKELGGSKKLPYPFFTAKPYINNRTLQIRNGGNDTQCRFLDPAVQTIVQTSGIDIDGQSYQPVHEFVNGRYIGVMNVREPNNKHYVYANYGWDDDEIDQFEISPDSFYVQKCGTDEAFQHLLELSANAADDDVYQEIRQLLDVDEYINYQAAEFYLGSSDWTRNNVKAFRYQDGGRFRFVLFDTDGSFSYSDNMFNYFMGMEYNYHFNALYPGGEVLVTDNTLVRLFRQLLQNASFRRQFIDTYCMMGGSVFEQSRCTQIIDSLSAITGPAMALNGDSPYNTANSLKNRFNNRNSAMIRGLQNYSTFQLSGRTAQAVTLSSDTEGARIEVNNVNIPTGKFSGNLFQPAKLKAVAPAGTVFQGWLSGGGNQTEIFPKASSWYYYDKGSLDGINWNSSGYSTSSWSRANAPLGYGMNGVATTISYGSNSSNKYPTYYFRRSFTLSDAPASNAVFNLNYACDDGFVVYINGTEAARYNMPTGTITFNTFSSTWSGSEPFEGTIELKGSLFKKGINSMAVEVHNTSASSSDIYWDAQLTGQLTTGEASYFSTNAEIDLPTGSVNLTASYRSMTDAERKAAGINPVRINEISAANSIYVNEYGNKNDWVELYNTTDQPIDIAGYYLTDNTSKPEKYQISAEGLGTNTVIPAHGRLLVWCDKLATTRQALHASFKLSAEGGSVMLTSADKSWTDVLRYEAHDGNHTYGRYPDGGNDIYAMTVPTIEKPNLLNSYDNVTDQTALNIGTQFVASANGLKLSYASPRLLVKGENQGNVRIDIYTTGGQLVESTTVALHSGRAQLDVSHLAAGLYIGRATDADGNRVSCKFATGVR